MSTQQTETAILAICIQASDLLPSILQEVNEYDFADTQSRVIYNAIKEHNQADTALLIDKLTESGKLEQAGGSKHITSLKFYQAESQHLDDYISTLKNARRKEAYLAQLRLSLREAEQTTDFDNLLAEHEAKLLPHLRSSGTYQQTTNSDRAAMAYNHIEQAKQSGNNLLGIDTGFTPFNDLTGGLIEGGYTVILGNPGAGKTALWLQMMQHVAQTHSPAAMVQLEMSEKLTALRQLAQLSGIGVDRLQKGDLTHSEESLIAQYTNELANSKNDIYSLDARFSAWHDIARWFRRMQTDKGCQTLWIDNLKIVDGLNNQNELERFQYVSRQIRLLARETNAHVVAIHHVTKIPVGRFITVNDAYGSSAFRQDADTVILMNKDIETGYIALEAGKARNGVEGLRRDVIFTGATQRFIEKSTERRF